MRLVTHRDFEGLVAAHGVAFWPVEASVRAIAGSQDIRALLESGKFLAILAQMAP